MERQTRGALLERSPASWGGIKYIFKAARGPVGFLWAFAMSRASLLGSVRPFGLAYVLTLKAEDRLWACTGLAAGSALLLGREGIGYSAACIIALAVDTHILRGRAGRDIWLPFVTAGAAGLVRCPFAFAKGAGSLGLLMLECVLTALCCYCLLLGGAGADRIRRRVIAVMACAAMARVGFFGLLTPSGVLAVLITMASAYEAPNAEGAAMGLITGAVLDMARGGGPFFSAAFGLSAVISGALPRRGRISFSLIYLLAGIACMAWSFHDPRSTSGVYDFFVASAVFLLLPERALEYKSASTPAAPPSIRAESGESLGELGRAIGAISKSIGDKLSSESPEEDICVIFDNAAAHVCKRCPRSGECWISGYGDTYGWLCAMLPAIKDKGHAEVSDMPEPFAKKCMRRDGLCGRINHEYMAYLRRRAERERERGKDILLKQQYDGLVAAVESLAAMARKEYLPRPLARKQVQEVLDAYGRGLRAEVFCSKGRMNIRVEPFEAGERWADESSFIRTVEPMLKLSLMPAETMEYKDGKALLYREREAFSVSVGCSVRKKPGERVCGDSVMYFKTNDGRYIVMLSDGMGTGAEAAALSKNALELMAAFIKSGCSARESAGAVVPFLTARYGFSGFATMDILEIDLFTGVCRIIKLGAADSFVIRGSSVKKISRPSLPPGAGGSAAPRPTEFFVREGDCLIMSSDGADISPAAVAGAVISAGDIVSRFGGEGEDDLSVIVISIDRVTPEDREDAEGRGNG